ARPCGDRGCELASVPVRASGPRAFSAVMDHVRLAGIRGGPRGAVSDVGDPTGRLTSVTASRLPDGDDVVRHPARSAPPQGVSPDSVDPSTRWASPPSHCFNTAGRIAPNGAGPPPRRERSPRPRGGAGARAALGAGVVGVVP